MALFLRQGRAPAPWAGEKYEHLPQASKGASSAGGALRIALVNNMPDSALEDTEEQFFSLLDAAADLQPIHVHLFSLPDVPRSERALRHLDNFYSSSGELLKQQFDGVIITGTEPKQPDLRSEPYWRSLTEVFDWAEQKTSSTVLSCLAAHAGVLHSDGIAREPIGEKRFGVFAHEKACEHFLTQGSATPVSIPHSRWNEVREEALVASGYTVLTRSAKAGVDLFVKQKSNSLFVHFQGHPEYMALTLFKEYRRDVRRYLRQERDIYPPVPEGNFDLAAERSMNEFRTKAYEQRSESIMDTFPEAAVIASLEHSWRASAAHIYRNWLHYLGARKNGELGTSAVSRVEHGPEIKESSAERAVVRRGESVANTARA